MRPSFLWIINLTYILLGVLPFGLVVYLLAGIDVPVTQGELLASAVLFLAPLIGFVLLRRNGKKLARLGFEVNKAVMSKAPAHIKIRGGKPKEVAELEQSFNTLFDETEGLRRNFSEMTTRMMLYTKDIESYQERLQEEAVLRARMNRYVPQNVVDQLLKVDGDLPMQHYSQEVTVLFADIRSFTTLSENMAPEDVISMLNEYFDDMVEVIFRHQGILDKFVGDELMAVFGLLGDAEQGPEHAIRAAMGMQERLRMLMAEHRLQGKPVFGVGIGINTGPVVVGNVGSKNRMDYTVIGDTVNVAARLEQMAEGGIILVGETTRQKLPPGMRAVEKGEIKVRNRADPVKCYAVIDR